MHKLLQKKHTGVLFPLFSMRSKHDWGVGDLPTLEAWLEPLSKAGINLVQFLPLNEMPPGVTCPYTAISAFAIDPMYIGIEAVPDLQDFSDLKEELAAKRFQTALRHLRGTKLVQYDDVKRLKFEFLWKIYARFHENHILKDSSRSRDFYAYVKANDWWLRDYALFRRLKDTHNWASWTHWEEPLRKRDPEALAEVEKRQNMEITFFKYLQWLLEEQWLKARKKAAGLGMTFMGDLPFMVNQEAADIWSRQEEFDLEKEAGAPPDAFSETGQRWGLPAYNWPALEKNNFEWWRSKTHKAATFYDFFRIDHMVGFFRTWVIPRDAGLKPDFDETDPEKQRLRGKRFLEAVIGASPMLPVAEDLGVIPPFVYETLEELEVPGYKVMRWEKTKPAAGKVQQYLEPAKYPRVSLATTSTHDNEPMADWWDTVDYQEKKLFWKMLSGKTERPPAFHAARETVTGKILEANSAILILPVQDLTGSKDRINLPNTMGEHNWTYRFTDAAEEFLKKHGELAAWLANTAKEKGRA